MNCLNIENKLVLVNKKVRLKVKTDFLNNNDICLNNENQLVLRS